MEGVRTIDPAAARIAPAERIEVDEPAFVTREAAPTIGTCDRGGLATANGDRAQLGIGRMDHVQASRAT
jgi:hypothetical protein